MARTNNVQSYLGAITRGPLDQKEIAFCFTAHSYAEGASTILDTLKKHRAKGSFFLTGEFVANTNVASIIDCMLSEGHYLGPHSDKHLLYCAWEPSRKTLVSREAFMEDLEANITKIEKRQALARTKNGVAANTLRPVRYFLPPYEHYNETIAQWTGQAGITLVNFTPGTRSAADYTGEADKNFVSSQTIYDSILAKENSDPHGLNGFMLLLHLGAGPGRADKFHTRFPELCEWLNRRGYRFVSIDEMLQGFE